MRWRKRFNLTPHLSAFCPRAVQDPGAEGAEAALLHGAPGAAAPLLGEPGGRAGAAVQADGQHTGRVVSGEPAARVGSCLFCLWVWKVLTWAVGPGT